MSFVRLLLLCFALVVVVSPCLAFSAIHTSDSHVTRWLTACNNKNNIRMEVEEERLSPVAMWMSANRDDSIVEESGVLCPPIPTTPSSNGDDNKDKSGQLATCVIAMG